VKVYSGCPINFGQLFFMPPHPDFNATLQYLYGSLPMFQRIGAVAYKQDLTNTLRLCEILGNPHQRFRSVHVAGTNGKGSSSHMLASILQCAGYKTGLYTSPHLKAFTERIKVNGGEVDQAFVVEFVERIRPHLDEIKPSFFETTVAMAFDYFVSQQVDIAVIEVGLGGRLDSTNVITPLVSLITNISYDHTDLLGKTLPAIAREKAGIIKPSVPVVVSQYQPEVEQVFVNKAKEAQAQIVFADRQYQVAMRDGVTMDLFEDGKFLAAFVPGLKGRYQLKNIPGVYATAQLLNQQAFHLSVAHIQEGIEKVVELTGLKGRWQKLGHAPAIFCDTGHNEDGIQEIVDQIMTYKFKNLFLVIGVVRDKDISRILRLLPKEAYYLFCQAKIPRALEAEKLQQEAEKYGLKGEVVPDVNDALRKAKNNAQPDDFIFVGGSTFVVAEIENL